MFRKLLRKIRGARFKYENLVEVRISSSAIRHNLDTFRAAYPKLDFVPVLKANAYGHGLAEVAKILDSEQVPFLAVDSYFEALVLRNEGVRSRILILGYTPLGNVLSSRLKDVAFTIVSMTELRALSAALEVPREFHLKIDTGMHRQGILWNEVEEAIAFLKQNPKMEISGILSHFADADSMDLTGTEEQIDNWHRAVEKLREAFPNIKYTHLSATAGSHFAELIDANLARLGLGLYGIDPQPRRELDLRPALNMRSVIASVKDIPKGAVVGYGRTFTADKPLKIATVPVGYSEGVSRELSSRGTFSVRDVPCPIIGRVSMNITTIDVSGVPEVKLGEPVVIISSDPQAPNSVVKIAEQSNQIPYEVLVHIPRHLKRVVVSG